MFSYDSMMILERHVLKILPEEADSVKIEVHFKYNA